MARFIFITGGVVSSLGKGLASAALGALLRKNEVGVLALLDAGISAELVQAASRIRALREDEV